MTVPKKNQASQIEKDKRIRMVVEWILDGYNHHDIRKQCMSWGINERSARRYIADANNLIKNLAEKELLERQAWHVETRKKLYRNLIQKDTPKGARAANTILDSIAKIDGSWIERVEHSGELSIKDLISSANEYNESEDK